MKVSLTPAALLVIIAAPTLGLSAGILIAGIALKRKII